MTTKSEFNAEEWDGRLVQEKATPEEAEEYRTFMLRLADVVAHAHKEG